MAVRNRQGLQGLYARAYLGISECSILIQSRHHGRDAQLPGKRLGQWIERIHGGTGSGSSSSLVGKARHDPRIRGTYILE